MAGVSFNLDGVADYSVNLPFIDLMKQARVWYLNAFDNPLPAEYIDADGWPTSAPGSILTIWAQSGDVLQGDWVLTFEGEGSFSVNNATVTSSSAGRREITKSNTGSIGLTITATDPNGTGNYLRNFRMVRAEHEALADAGEIFNPRFLDLYRTAKPEQLRFMDWMGTNGSAVSDWADRPLVTDYTYAKAGGVPLEIMVALANELGVDPWFNIPHLATDEYVTNFAAYVRDNLDAALTAHFEYSNETWNSAFSQTTYVQAQGVAAAWTVNGDYEKGQQWVGYRMAQVSELIREVFDADSGDRWVGVLSTWPVSTYYTNQRLLGVAHHIDSDAGVPVGTTVAKLFSTLAITTYFGTGLLGGAYRSTLIDYIGNHTEIETFEWITGLMLDSSFTSSVPANALLWAGQGTIAAANGLALSAYEGGTHILHSFAVSPPITTEEQAIFVPVLISYSFSEQIAEVYDACWTAWEALTDEAFMEFVAVAAASSFGAWGAKRNLDDINPRWAVHMSRSRGLPYRDGCIGVSTVV